MFYGYERDDAIMCLDQQKKEISELKSEIKIKKDKIQKVQKIWDEKLELIMDSK